MDSFALSIFLTFCPSEQGAFHYKKLLSVDFSSLPPELVFHIFRFFDQKLLRFCRLVCSNWNTIIIDNSLLEPISLKVSIDGGKYKKRIAGLTFISAFWKSPYFYVNYFSLIARYTGRRNWTNPILYTQTLPKIPKHCTFREITLALDDIDSALEFFEQVENAIFIYISFYKLVNDQNKLVKLLNIISSFSSLYSVTFFKNNNLTIDAFRKANLSGVKPKGFRMVSNQFTAEDALYLAQHICHQLTIQYIKLENVEKLVPVVEFLIDVENDLDVGLFLVDNPETITAYFRKLNLPSGVKLYGDFVKSNLRLMKKKDWTIYVCFAYKDAIRFSKVLYYTKKFKC
ncbi:hypothetical protein L596_012200 [Steinernema carpocapsae]|uniref:F-box domain-containing protein n=1 Tax=Steinernema carpocapsae TaxID=34508 RepID=A0A4V6XWE9_STECR|nr:hypothetical protein L596_012200 [Steinernema carpocapsae]